MTPAIASIPLPTDTSGAVTDLFNEFIKVFWAKPIPNKNRSGLDVHCRYAVPNDTKIGASVCLNGVCSTIVSTSETSFFIQLLSETLEISTFNDIAVGDYLNLEWSLTPSSKMGGHIVSGHVDDVGVIEEISWGEKWGTLVIEFDEKWKNNR